MATNNRRISVAELDFDAIKTNLKAFLKDQDQFSDYDFDGSAMSVLIDLLAYNTHYNGVYTNLAVNEMFLDSASKRSSVVSLAKMLGYTPKSARSARAKINATITTPTSTPSTVTLPAYQTFSCSVDGKTYTFYNREAKTISQNNDGDYIFNNIEIVEGTQLRFKYTVANGTRYIIPNSNVDLSTLIVRVQDNASSDEYTYFSKIEDIVTASQSSNVYFVKEIDDGLYEIYFGNNIIGTSLSNGNVVTFDYFVSSLEAVNGAYSFTYGGTPLLSSNLSITSTAVAAEGASPEDITSIKFNAPRMYAAQNRAVTPEDYRALVYTLLPEAQTVMVWGGENNTPKIYGKTYICIKPQDALKLTNLQKDNLKAGLISRNVVGISPEIVDPEYLFVKINTTVYYNDRNTSKTYSQLETLVKNAIFAYDDAELQKFDGVLRFSKMSKIIDAADASITNNITKLSIVRQVTPKYNVNAEYLINIINPISQAGNKLGDVFSSSGFFIPNSNETHYLDDDEVGNVRLFYYDSNYDKVFINSSIGTVDYANGIVNIKNLNITSLKSGAFEFYIIPDSYDVVSALNQIVEVDRANLVVNIVADKSSSGNMEAGYNYTFTSIR